MDIQKSSNQSALIKAMLEKKKEYGFTYREIADLSGLPLGTVQKVFGGFTKNPRRETLAALAGFLLPEQDLFIGQVPGPGSVSTPGSVPNPASVSAQGSVPNPASVSNPGPVTNPAKVSQAGRRQDSYTVPVEVPLYLREGAPAYVTGLPKGKKQGEYTIEDRNALPEDHPSELIDGVIYNMASPALRHQSISGSIYRQLWSYVDAHGGDCIPFIAPTDVRLDRDERTMVVPDVFVICQPDDDRMDNDKYINGAPDLIIEVLSPSTRRKDMFTKLHKYEEAGVREYWIVDPQKEKIIVYIFGEDSDVSLYGFDSEIPVSIYQGECRIDFRRILRDLKRLRP
ncbi:MAG: Uma2 family endonuclease [Eubacteriales bacterium]|nr:Uma2 family endonuclease [Eubacteriales bacterium]